MAVIQIDHLRKHYGKHVGVRDVTFSVEQGEIFGFVGRNGAGKSTTIKVLMGFIYGNGGSASICGLDVVRDTKKIKAFTGYVPSDVRLYESMRVGELLRRSAGFYAGDCGQETARLVDRFEVDLTKRFRELSSGNRKKVSIVCALAFSPRVIILDEPTNGLDPVMQKELFEELARRTAGGATVLLSSHNLAEVEAYCDRVAFIKSGTIRAVTDLKNAARPSKIITVTGGAEKLPGGVELVRREGAKRVLRAAPDGAALVRLLETIAPTDFTVEDERMEDYFWNLYGEEDEK